MHTLGWQRFIAQTSLGPQGRSAAAVPRASHTRTRITSTQLVALGTQTCARQRFSAPQNWPAEQSTSVRQSTQAPRAVSHT